MKRKIARERTATASNNSNTIDGDQFRDSLTYRINLNNINTQCTKRIQICSLILQIEGSGDGGRSVRQLGQPFTAPDCQRSLEACPRPWPESSPVWIDMVSYRRPGSVPLPDDTRARLGFRQRQGQMTRMPLGLSKGGKLFKKAL